MTELKHQYRMLETRNAHHIAADGPCASSSPSKNNARLSPSRVPKAKITLQPEHLMV
jgi:hypothetical protein